MTKAVPLFIPDEKESQHKRMVYAPFDGTVLAEVSLAEAKHVEKALAHAYSLAQDKSQHFTLPERIKLFEEVIKVVESRAHDLITTAVYEGGKPLKDTRVEMARAIEGLKACLTHLRHSHGQVVPMNLSSMSSDRMAFTQKFPLGVVVALSAFNHPINLVVHQMATAIAAGCPVIMKPASDTPLSCFALAECFYEAGLPEAWCQVLLPIDHELTTKLATDSRVALLNFIGSETVGWALRSKLSPGQRCILEHGGIAPVILDGTSEFETMTATTGIPQAIAKGGFYHAGQVCVSTQHVYVPFGMARMFAGQIAAAATEFIVGDPSCEKTDIGPLIRKEEVTRVHDWVNDAVALGADLVCGGELVGDQSYACTVLFNPPEDALVTQKEIFGPVIAVYPYQTIEEAYARINAQPYVFQSALFSDNINTITQAFQSLDTTALMVNNHTAFREDNMPFYGLRQSGLGKGGIGNTIDEMQYEKMMVLGASSFGQ